jgi:hypothetical protein
MWNDYTVTESSTLFKSLANIVLVSKFDCTLCQWLNTETVDVTVANPNVGSITGANSQLQYALIVQNNTFTSACLFTANYCSNLSANGGIPALLYTSYNYFC